MEKRILRVSFSKSGSGSISPKLSIPKSFLEKIEVTQENREIEIELNTDTNEIIIRKKK
ncbi:AbrB/MazE/SpoVT family DNA-binding domain-containing protein [Fusobacterium animalis]|uniref:AbrB/MazE/SpoVT family DNA-binding domain-containing protein n=1 Tax=Fusobacterium animalis TaxID=76859 RepID=UPI00130E00F9|nr:AbrB/MazE/SpoVT family DNA-binding domain-containing protein [Fusobacterium animalis]